MDNPDYIIKTLHSDAALLLKEKNTDEAVIDYLMQRGIEKHYAETILDNVKNDKSDQKEFYKHLFMGAFVFSAGLILTVMTYRIATSGSMYLVFWGFMVYGIISVARAFIIFRK